MLAAFVGSTRTSFISLSCSSGAYKEEGENNEIRVYKNR